MSETLEVGGLRFQVVRAPRKTLSLVVGRHGELVIRAPESAPGEDLARWARTKLLWVHGKLAVKQKSTPKVREPEFVSGESFSYLGRSYRLTLTVVADQPLRFDGRRFFLRRDARSSASDHFRRWYIAVGTPWIQRRTALLAPKAGACAARVEVRDLGYRWGSCGRTGVLYFNWKLLQLPVRLADYVIAHELGHLSEPHHDPGFRRLLDRSMPDWQQRREELASRARDIYWCSAVMET